MTQWTNDQLDKIGGAEEVQIASRRRDGTLRRPVTVWAVRHGDDLYARSVRGRDGLWFRGTQDMHEGQVRAGGVQHEVTFVDAGDEIEAEIDEAYRAKYRRYAGRILDSVLTAEAQASSIKLVPRSMRS